MQAMLVCIMCDVREQCLEKKKRTGSEHGVWGGVPSKKGVDYA